MTMPTPTQAELVRTTFALVEPDAEAVSVRFYARLFELEPELRRLFPADMAAQRRSLMQMLGVAVRGLDRLDQLVPAVQEMGARHATYGVEDGHYAIVGRALLDTLEAGLGDAFTAEVRDAWTVVYQVLAGTMQHGADTAARPVGV